MEIKHFEIEHLLISAMHKCDNISDAEDLVSDTILAAYEYLSKGKKIDNPRAWLTTVLSHKWNDMLRKRYKQTFIPFDEVVDGYNDEVIEELDIVDEAQELRKEIAYLSKIYREVIVEYYMNGKSVTEISKKLNLPEGTIKSRLYSGREHLKKGLVQMEKYSSQSYKPVRLYIANSGNNGINNEPQSLISDDLIAQNILWLSYDSPKTIEEISRLLGIPTAYIEPIIEKLVAGELMKNNGSRYYTDFIIFSMKEKEQYITQQKQFIKSNYEQTCSVKNSSKINL